MHLKEVYYFPHDANARHDPNILQMRSVYGAEGYGWYWMLVEKMREENSYKLRLNGKHSINGVAIELCSEPENIKRFIDDCINEFELFRTDGEYFWSDSLLRRMALREEKSFKARIGAMARWEKEREKDANAVQSQCERSAVAMQGKERKGKERKQGNLAHAVLADLR